MQVKTYRGSTTQAAFAKVKAELGEDAVILGSKTIEENGRRLTEVTAAVERTLANETTRSKDDVLSEALSGSLPWAREWLAIRDHFLALLKPQMNLATLSQRQRAAMEYLEREGVDDSVLLELFRELSGDPERTILPVLEKIAMVLPFESKKWPQKFHVFAGPHGVGKTSSLLRLALLEKQKKQKARICVASSEQGQGKGRSMLRHYAELSGLAFREIGGRQDFQLLAEEAAGFARVFVDLPALPPGATLAAQLAALGMAESRDLAAHLVLNPYFSSAQLAAFAERYACGKPGSLIWTKLDEACTFGALVNMAHATGLPVSALSFGAGLKNSLAPASVETLWRLVFKHQMPFAAARKTVQ